MERILYNKVIARYLKNASWLLLEKVFRFLSAFIIGAWVIRYLGPNDFGLLSYVQSFTGIFIVIASLGLDEIIVRYLVEESDLQDEIIATAICLKFFGAVLAFFMLLCTTLIVNRVSYTSGLILLAGFSMIFQSASVISCFFQSKILSKYTVFANIIVVIVGGLLKIFFILKKSSLITFVALMLFDSFLLSFFMVAFFLSYVNKPVINFRFNTLIAKQLMSSSWPMLLTTIVMAFYFNTSQLIIKSVLDYEDLSYYSVAYKLVVTFEFLPAIIVNTMFPMIIEAKKTTFYIDKLKNIFNLVFLLGIVIAAFLMFGADVIINTLYGHAYRPVIPVLQYMAISGVLSSIGYLSGRIYIAEGLEKVYLCRVILGFFSLCGFSLILVPKYASMGAVFSLILSEIFVVYIADLLFFEKTKHILLMKLKVLYSFVNPKNYQFLIGA